MNPECYIRRLAFPNRSVEAAVFPNDDGTFDIYINTLCSQPVQEAALHHELEHIRLNHFYCDKDIRQKEREADGLCPAGDGSVSPFLL
jgi:predicted metal-dependent peptidase